jgi:hypothetical protein
MGAEEDLEREIDALVGEVTEEERMAGEWTGAARGNAQGFPDWLPTPWRIEEDWTLEVTAANGRVVHRLPLQCMAEARWLVEAVNKED